LERKILNVIILAAGKGERLRPLTNDKPKCMVELFGKSILEWQIEKFQKFGITDITIITGYKSESIVYPQFNLVKNPKFDSTNMVETLFCAREKLLDSTIISYGDILFEDNVLKKIIDSDEDFSIIVDKNWLEYWEVRNENPLNDAESLMINSKGYLTSIGQKVENIEEIQGQYIGLMKFQNTGTAELKSFYDKSKKSSLSGINPLNKKLKFQNSFMTDLLHSMILEDYNLKSINIKNGWLEIDTISDFELYQKMSNDGTLSKFFNQ
jgi:L-glutamine-phosphate cytidylyltransferase